MTGDVPRGAEATRGADADGARADPPPRPAPLDPPMLPFALGGTAVWALVALALLPFRGRLEAAGHGSWLWICLAGILIGFVGVAVMRRYDVGRRRRRRED